MSTIHPLLKIVQDIRNQAPNGFKHDDITQIRKMTARLMDLPEALMAVISIGKAFPQGVNLDNLMQACEKHNPLLLDELMAFPGIDTTAMQERIIKNLSIPQSLARIAMWYPSEDPLPLELQTRVANLVASRVIYDITEGPSHKRELSLENGLSLGKAIDWIGTKIVEEQAVFPLLRATHYVLKGMGRTLELHHQLDDAFVEKVFNANWSHYTSAPSTKCLVNAVAFTLSNRDLFPDALSFLALHHPQAHAIVAPVWNHDSKDITKFLNAMKKDANMEKTILSRGSKTDCLGF